MLKIITCTSINNVLGFQNSMPWGKFPADLKRFKNLTTNNTVIMGRKTAESIKKPLDNRNNIILTRDSEESLIRGPFKDCSICNTLSDLTQLLYYNNDRDIFIIGGGEIYKIFLPFTNTIYLTVINKYYQGDTYFPIIDNKIWEETEREDFIATDKFPHSYSFITLERRFKVLTGIRFN